MTEREKGQRIYQLGVHAINGTMSRQKLLKRAAALGVLPSVVALLAACGGDDDSAAPAPAEPAPAPADPAPAPAPAAPAVGDSVVILETEIAPGLDGEGTSFGQISTQTSLAQLYEHLIQPVRTEDADGVLVPDFSAYEGRLAESWEQNGLEWTWKLREGVISAAGNELTTKDVEYSLSRIKAFSPIPIGWFLMTVASILSLDIPTLDPSERGLADEFEAIDDYTFILRQLEPSPNLLTVLPVVSLGIFDSTVMLENATGEDPFSREWADQVGSAGFGAYSLTNWDKGASISMTVNPDYFRGEPEFKNLTFQRVPQSGARVTAIQSGDANVTTGLSPKEFNELDQAEEVDVLSWLGNVFVALGPNYLFEPWAAGGDLATSRLLRQAMAFAVPYDDIIEQDFFGQAIKWNGLISSKFYGAVDFGDRYTYDPARASELLAEAGFPDGEGLAGPGLTLSYIAEHASFIEPVANRIRTAFADVGINIDLDPLPQTQFVDRETNLDDIPFSLLDQQVAIGPDAGYQSQLNHVSTENAGLDNSTNYNSAAFDAIYLEQKVNVDVESRLAQMEAMQEILMEDLPRIPILERASQIAVTAGITNWAPKPDGARTGEIWYMHT
jgi:peptide/nickel transport system substrate-binding protein